MKNIVFGFGRHFNKIRYTAVVSTMTLMILVGACPTLFAAEPQKESSSTTIFSSVDSTLEKNPRLMELKQNREAAQYGLKQTKGRYYPRIDLNAGYGTDSHSDIGTRSRDEENDFDARTEASLTLVQPLYQGGETRSLVEQQTAKLDSANYRVYDNAESLALDAIIAHIEVWRQRQLLKLTELNIQIHEKILDQISEQQKAGAGSSADVVQTKGRLALTRSSQFQISGELEKAKVNYYRVVGHYPEKLILPDKFRLLAPSNADQSIETAQTCNPKLAAFTEDIRAARSEIDVRKSNYYPKLNLELSTTYEDQVESSTSYTHNNAAMIRGRWNLYNGGSDSAARDAAVSQKLELVSARQDLFYKLVEQIRGTWSQYLTSGHQIKTYTEAVQYNKKTRDAYQQQFTVGQRSLLDVLDSENELFQSSSRLTTAKANEIVAVYRLLALSGCLLTSLEMDIESYGLTAVSNNCCTQSQNVDSDGDGILDDNDQCPGTPAGVVVGREGCPVDGDLDTVPDYRDKCPNTPLGEMVDDKGCPRVKPKESKSAMVTDSGTFLYKDIQFETNKWDLKPHSHTVLDEITGWLKSNPGLVVEIQGHTDNKGDRNFNIALSQKRAQSVITYLKHKGIDTARMTSIGYGPDRPIADNHTVQGRSKNRRVEIKPIKW
jgi:adhesin transport system outer membrane protein